MGKTLADAGSDPVIWPFRRRGKPKPKLTRTRILVQALIICVAVGILGPAYPLEDVYRGLRNQIAARPADGEVIVIAIDDRTAEALGGSSYSRGYNADLVDGVFALGAQRVYFDEVFSRRVDSEGDRRFAEALARHHGRVFSGTMKYRKTARSKDVEFVLPHPDFRPHTTIRSLGGAATPLGLSAELNWATEVNGIKVPSISASIANRNGPVDERYRPDWSIQVASVPTISMIDVLEGKVPAEQLKGKDLLVGVTTRENPDDVQIVGQGWFPGVYVHAVGAQTLKEGHPIKAGWIPGMILATILSIALMVSRTRPQARLIVLAAVVLGIALPFALDRFFITVDVFPAALLFAIVAYRFNSWRDLSEARYHNAGSLLPNLSALREDPEAATRHLIAMRIRNYAAICASFSTPVEHELIGELTRRLSLPQGKTLFYQAEDVIYWLTQPLPEAELTDHLTGLSRLVESQFELCGRKLDIAVTFGVDTSLDRPIANRIGRALLAADNAAAKHQLVTFNHDADEAESAWELSLMSELDAAIDGGDIWVAYQPQYSLKTDRICGAEALVRWQHPVRGAISPKAFVLSAEAHNRIARLTLHVLDAATRAARPLLAVNPEFRLGVNLSASMLEAPQLPGQIVEILIRNGFPARNLTLEV
ncbi:MAG: EAL domain-containing protein, partial [Novosphingobium sp.]